MLKSEADKAIPEALLLRETGYDFEWLHHAFTFEKKKKGTALRTNGSRDGIAVVDIGGGKKVSVDFRRFYEADPMEQVCIVKRGVNARLVDVLAESMQMPKGKLISALGLSAASLQRKSSVQAALSSNESSRVVGMGKLIGQAQVMVEESGEADGFDPAVWVGHWLDQPVPALSGGRPCDLMDTAEGQAVVSQLLGRLRSGVYA